MGMPLKDIVPLWQKYLTEIAEHRADVMRVPAASSLQSSGLRESRRGSQLHGNSERLGVSENLPIRYARPLPAREAPPHEERSVQTA